MEACINCEKSTPSKELKACAHCPDALYCSRECQATHWTLHKTACRKNTAKDKGKGKMVEEGPQTQAVAVTETDQKTLAKTPLMKFTLTETETETGTEMTVDMERAPVVAGSAGHSAGSLTDLFDGLDNAEKILDDLKFMPFTRLNDGAWLHDRQETEVYQLLVECYRIHIADMHTKRGQVWDNHLSKGERGCGFQTFLSRVEGKGYLMPPWWNREKRAACGTLSRDVSQWHNLRTTVADAVLVARYEDPDFPLQLRMFNEEIYDPGPIDELVKKRRSINLLVEKVSKALRTYKLKVSQMDK